MGIQLFYLKVMASKKLELLSKKMRKLDICMLTTAGARGSLTSRPMSNNGDVKYDGNSYFFTYRKSHVVSEIKRNAQVHLGFEGNNNLFISVSGKATPVTSKAVMKKHWIDQLKQWFEEGVDTPGIIMIHVKATRIRYWEKSKEADIRIK